jgi:inhibitor of KinA
MISAPTCGVFGDHAVLLNWPAQVSDQCHHWVTKTERIIVSQFEKSIIETVPTYHSLAIYLQPNINPKSFIESLNDQVLTISEANNNATQVVTIPVCYDPIFALDIEEVAKFTHCTTEKVVELHTRPTYKLFFMGFLPGFPYLGGLLPELHISRKASPRSVVEKGSVGIGGIQTGIYPSRSPGGWNLLGRTPVAIFDIQKQEPSIFNEVGAVRFRAISKQEFELISDQLSKDSYILEKEVWNG